jgi:hypothetical protein
MRMYVEGRIKFSASDCLLHHPSIHYCKYKTSGAMGIGTLVSTSVTAISDNLAFWRLRWPSRIAKMDVIYVNLFV